MLDRLNVQVENPVCIMDQENSKEFIKGNERDKYRFFKKATDLERVVTGIQESKSDLESMSAIFNASYSKLRGVAEDAEKVLIRAMNSNVRQNDVSKFPMIVEDYGVASIGIKLICPRLNVKLIVLILACFFACRRRKRCKIWKRC